MPRISVVIPCYNEAATIGRIVAQVRSALAPGDEIVLVDDGSTDGTRAILEQEIAPLGVQVILHERNRGKGAALHTGFARTTGDIVIVQDADLEYDPIDYPKLIAPIVERGADVVFGSRFVGMEAHRVLLFWHSVANRILTLLSNMASNLNLTDVHTGYKVFRGELVRSLRLREPRFGFDAEVTIKVARRRCVVYEVGIAYHGRTYAEGKKVGLRDAVRSLYCILRYRFAD